MISRRNWPLEIRCWTAPMRCLSCRTLSSIRFQSYCCTGLLSRCMRFCTEWACIDFRIVGWGLVHMPSNIWFWRCIKNSSPIDIVDSSWEYILFVNLWSALHENRSFWRRWNVTLDVDARIRIVFRACDYFSVRTSTLSSDNHRRMFTDALAVVLWFTE